MTLNRLQCVDCRHYHRIPRGERHDQPRTCDAFPDGIPEPILYSRHDHREPYPGDHGIRFTPMTETDRERERELAREAAERYRRLTEEMQARRRADAKTSAA